MVERVGPEGQISKNPILITFLQEMDEKDGDVSIVYFVDI